MKILVIMLYWYPYEGPLMPIYGEVFRYLKSRGHDVTIVTSFPHYRKGREERWEEHRGKAFEVTQWSGVRVIRSFVCAPFFTSEKVSLIYRALNFVSFNLSSLLTGIFLGGGADIVFAPSSPPLTNGIISWLVSVFKRCPVVYNVQDLYPDMAVKLGLTRSRVLLRALKTAEKAVYRLSTRVLAISGKMKDIISEKGVSPQKIEVIENFIDTDFISPGSQDNPFSRSSGLAEKFVVMYAGNIGIPHGVEVLVDAAEKLKDEPEIMFCFVARGENRQKVVSQARQRGLVNTLFLSQQPEALVPLIWASASVGVVTYRRGLADFSVPSKLLAMMCAARPVIASVDEDSETGRLVSVSQCGLVVAPGSADKIAEAVLRLKKDERERQQMGQNGRRFAVTKFRREVVVARYEALFESLITKDA